MEVIEFRPEREQYAFTFGGVAPVRKIHPGTALKLWTDDAFCGNIRQVTDLPSSALTMPFVNPQTGPFHMEGAEPGDKLALHFVDLTPARSFGASCTIPLFGGLTSTDRTATLQDPLPERTWIYDVDRERQTVAFQAGPWGAGLSPGQSGVTADGGKGAAGGSPAMERPGRGPGPGWGEPGGCRGSMITAHRPRLRAAGQP